ncbi:YlbE-like family protein [Radiobacillus deserti]|uniref:YlbE-like family protein n=1 Tax=Radiobacillus deserti TaxID=2594883 RepID=A0A516KF97_9BACI|nr:YlbE-like family protein [Radiobacillus deserti]QDP40069.1 hypothetical protein FN924_07755 [Radiobacillus deserti]
MQPSLYQYIQSNQEMVSYIREHPEWYRRLTRNPDSIQEMEQEMKVYYGRTVPQKMERFASQMQMVSMFIQLAGSMKD